MKVKYMNVVYDLNNDFDREQLEIFARIAGKGESLEEYLLRETLLLLISLMTMVKGINKPLKEA